jgi:hypothetical protein
MYDSFTKYDAAGGLGNSLGTGTFSLVLTLTPLAFNNPTSVAFSTIFTYTDTTMNVSFTVPLATIPGSSIELTTPYLLPPSTADPFFSATPICTYTAPMAGSPCTLSSGNILVAESVIPTGYPVGTTFTFSFTKIFSPASTKTAVGYLYADRLRAQAERRVGFFADLRAVEPQRGCYF